MFRYLETTPLYNGTQNYPVPDVYNQKLIGVNPASLGIWMAMKGAEKWRTQLGALYSVTVDGLGNSLINQIAFTLMIDENFVDAPSVKASLWPTNDDVTIVMAELMRTDLHYGLNK